MIQDTAWSISWILIAALAAVFAWIVLGARDKAAYESVLPTAAKIRRVWFIALVALGVGVAGWTLPLLPYPQAKATVAGAQVIDATAKQWAWTLSATEAKVGTPVEFRVTSSDVNHGFALYSPDMKVLAQVQAMPGYVNRMTYTFAKPGTYKVLCLEYCGLIHHQMTAEIVVR